MKNAQIKKKRIHLLIYMVGVISVLIMNLIAWKSTSFCDFYIQKIFPVLGMAYGRITSLLPFSVGEILLYLSVVITIVGLCFAVFFLFCRFYRKKNYKILSIAPKYGVFYAWMVLITSWIMTLNCSFFYHTTGFAERYKPSALSFLTITNESQLAYLSDLSGGVLNKKIVVKTDRKTNDKGNPVYSYDELATLRDYLVEKCNRLAYQMERDEENKIVYQNDLKEASLQAMLKMGKVYDQLDGYYVTPKELASSDFFSQQYILGYYFPFSMEANINKNAYITNIPPTICHELAHTKGFIYEDDANMIGYLACINADDSFVEYCGYLSVLNYVNNDFFKSIGKNKTKYSKHVQIDPLVCQDNIFLEDSAWKKVEKKAIVSTKVVKKVSGKFTDTALKLNGVSEGSMQYNQVVDQLLQYYDGMLY